MTLTAKSSFSLQHYMIAGQVKAYQAVFSSVLWNPEETSKVASTRWDGLINFLD